MFYAHTSNRSELYFTLSDCPSCIFETHKFTRTVEKKAILLILALMLTDILKDSSL